MHSSPWDTSTDRTRLQGNQQTREGKVDHSAEIQEEETREREEIIDSLRRISFSETDDEDDQSADISRDWTANDRSTTSIDSLDDDHSLTIKDSSVFGDELAHSGYRVDDFSPSTDNMLTRYVQSAVHSFDVPELCEAERTLSERDLNESQSFADENCPPTSTSCCPDKFKRIIAGLQRAALESERLSLGYRAELRQEQATKNRVENDLAVSRSVIENLENDKLNSVNKWNGEVKQMDDIRRDQAMELVYFKEKLRQSDIETRRLLDEREALKKLISKLESDRHSILAEALDSLGLCVEQSTRTQQHLRLSLVSNNIGVSNNYYNDRNHSTCVALESIKKDTRILNDVMRRLKDEFITCEMDIRTGDGEEKFSPGDCEKAVVPLNAVDKQQYPLTSAICHSCCLHRSSSLHELKESVSEMKAAYHSLSGDLEQVVMMGHAFRDGITEVLHHPMLGESACGSDTSFNTNFNVNVDMAAIARDYLTRKFACDRQHVDQARKRRSNAFSALANEFHSLCDSYSTLRCESLPVALANMTSAMNCNTNGFRRTLALTLTFHDKFGQLEETLDNMNVRVLNLSSNTAKFKFQKKEMRAAIMKMKNRNESLDSVIQYELRAFKECVQQLRRENQNILRDMLSRLNPFQDILDMLKTKRMINDENLTVSAMQTDITCMEADSMYSRRSDGLLEKGTMTTTQLRRPSSAALVRTLGERVEVLEGHVKQYKDQIVKLMMMKQWIKFHIGGSADAGEPASKLRPGYKHSIRTNNRSTETTLTWQVLEKQEMGYREACARLKTINTISMT